MKLEFKIEKPHLWEYGAMEAREFGKFSMWVQVPLFSPFLADSK